MRAVDTDDVVWRTPEIIEDLCVLGNKRFDEVSANLFLLTQSYLKAANHKQKVDHVDSSRHCPVCLDHVSFRDTGHGSEALCHLECSHVYHVSCFQRHIQSYVRQENLTALLQCGAEQCNGNVAIFLLGENLDSVEALLSVQKLFVRAAGGVFCPECGEGVGFSQKNVFCQNCHKFLCFQCGLQAHRGSCQDFIAFIEREKGFLRTNRFSEQDSYESTHMFLMSLDPALFGLCPFCHILIEHRSGCYDMLCGQNSPEREQIGKLFSHRRGCGKKFHWGDRILVHGHEQAVIKSLGGYNCKQRVEKSREIQLQKKKFQLRTSQVQGSIWRRLTQSFIRLLPQGSKAWSRANVLQQTQISHQIKHQTIEKLTLRWMNLQGFVFKNCELIDVVFDSVDLRGAIFNGSCFRGVVFRHSDLRGTQFHHEGVARVIFEASAVDYSQIEKCVRLGIRVTGLYIVDDLQRLTDTQQEFLFRHGVFIQQTFGRN
ncbi:MAG: pentapeptide repeat-containing protein [Oligoflexales bacterium]